jgi:hypothetical protein
LGNCLVMIPNDALIKAGILPFRKGPIRFAVGPPTGLTSNAWRLWTNKKGDVYLACRDNIKEAKVSLHISGRWRIGFTTEALTKNTKLLPTDQNRALEVWDAPPPAMPNTVVAFRLLFPTSELAVRPDQRTPEAWANVIFIEAGPPGKMTVLTLFITTGEVILSHETEPSFCLASLNVGSGHYAQLVAHGEPDVELPAVIERNVSQARFQAERAGVEVPIDGYVYFFGQMNDGSRYILGARMSRSVSAG